jgi:ankyrin repeat protein
MFDAKELFEAIATGNTDRVQTLLKAQPDLASVRNEKGLSPLLFAAYNGRPECATLLQRMMPRLSVLEAAAIGAIEELDALLQTESVNARSSDGFTSLHLAAFFGQTRAAELLVRKGANVNAESENPARLTPLNSAAACRNLQSGLAISQLLIRNGADPSHAQAGGFTPLHSAAANGNRELVLTLIAAGADRRAVSQDGRTPVTLATERGHGNVVAILT